MTLNSFFAIQSSHYNFKQCCISSFLRADNRNANIGRDGQKNMQHGESMSQKYLSQINIRKATILPKHHKHKVNEPFSAKNIRIPKIS